MKNVMRELELNRMSLIGVTSGLVSFLCFRLDLTILSSEALFSLAFLISIVGFVMCLIALPQIVRRGGGMGWIMLTFAGLILNLSSIFEFLSIFALV